MSLPRPVSTSTSRSGTTLPYANGPSAAQQLSVVLDDLQKNASHSIPATGDNRAARRLQQARRERKESQELKRNGGVPKGDPAGNFAMSVIKMGEAAGSMLTDTATAAWESLPGKEQVLESASENLAWAGGQLWNACEGAGSLASGALEGVRTALQFHVGPPGAEGAQVSQDAAQCSVDGSDRCAGLPRLSKVSLAKFVKGFEPHFRITVSPLLETRDDRSLSNAFVVVLEPNHGDPEARARFAALIQNAKESGDKIFVEWSVGKDVPADNCFGFESKDCVPIDDPAETARLRKLGKAADALAREALGIIAKHAKGRVRIPDAKEQMGVVTQSLAAAFGQLQRGEIRIPPSSSDFAGLRSLQQEWQIAFMQFKSATESRESNETRDKYMAARLIEWAAKLGGNKGFVVIGWAHRGIVKALEAAGFGTVAVEQPDRMPTLQSAH